MNVEQPDKDHNKVVWLSIIPCLILHVGAVWSWAEQSVIQFVGDDITRFIETEDA